MVDGDPTDECSLVRRLRAGEHAALAALVDRYGDDVLRYLTTILHDRAEAEDAFQDTWVRVMRRADTLDPRRPFKPWLLRVARNRAYDRLRWYRRWRRVLAVPAVAQTPAPDPPEPSDFRDGVIARDAVGRLLATLPPHQREVVWLRYYAECSHGEIAALCGIAVGTVKSRLSRALTDLGEGWRKLEEAEHERT